MKTLDMLREMRQVVADTTLEHFSMRMYYTATECGYKACIMGEIAMRDNLVHFDTTEAKRSADHYGVSFVSGVLHSQLSATAYKELGEFAVNIDLLTAAGPNFLLTGYSKALLPQMLKHPHNQAVSPRPAETLDCIDMLIAHIEEHYNAE